jgi:hypothetical protein
MLSVKCAKCKLDTVSVQMSIWEKGDIEPVDGNNFSPEIGIRIDNKRITNKRNIEQLRGWTFLEGDVVYDINISPV